jgi:hypothetical protein
MPRSSPRMTDAEFDAALLPLITASRAAARLDVTAITAGQAESALVLARGLHATVRKLAGRIHAQYPLLRAEVTELATPEPGRREVQP